MADRQKRKAEAALPSSLNEKRKSWFEILLGNASETHSEETSPAPSTSKGTSSVADSKNKRRKQGKNETTASTVFL